MTNEEILSRWYEAEHAHRQATGSNYGQTLYRKMIAEQAAIERFGLGLHLQAYRVRFPGEKE